MSFSKYLLLDRRKCWFAVARPYLALLKRQYVVLRRFGLIFFLLFITACSTNPPLLTTEEDLVIKILTQPEPPTTGDGQLLIYITKRNGQPINDLKVSVSVTASGMRSGTQDGMAVKRSSGVYAYPVKFHMESKYAIRLWVYRNGNVIAIQDSEIALR